MNQYLLSIDQGTTSSRAMLFNSNGTAAFTAQQEFTQYFPDDGWVEHNAEEIWSTTHKVLSQALEQAQADDREIAAIGITNQRETTVIWDRSNGKPIYNAIVWQDRRTAAFCSRLRGPSGKPKLRMSSSVSSARSPSTIISPDSTNWAPRSRTSSSRENRDSLLIV